MGFFSEFFNYFFIRQMLQVTKQQQQLGIEYFSFDLT